MRQSDPVLADVEPVHRARPGPADRADLHQPVRFGRRGTGRAAQAHDGRVAQRRVPQPHIGGQQPVAGVQAKALRWPVDAARPGQRLGDGPHGRVGVGVEVDVERVTVPLDHGQHQRHETSSSRREWGAAGPRSRAPVPLRGPTAPVRGWFTGPSVPHP
ncbi:hypothetical protein O1L68_21655 [Streptomyces lydicus]|nr:hypothetical protein [Streptomyces lydicus]